MQWLRLCLRRALRSAGRWSARPSHLWCESSRPRAASQMEGAVTRPSTAGSQQSSQHSRQQARHAQHVLCLLPSLLAVHSSAQPTDSCTVASKSASWPQLLSEQACCRPTLRKQQPRALGRREAQSLGGAMVQAPQPGVAAQLWQQSASEIVGTTVSGPAVWLDWVGCGSCGAAERQQLKVSTTEITGDAHMLLPPHCHWHECSAANAAAAAAAPPLLLLPPPAELPPLLPHCMQPTSAGLPVTGILPRPPMQPQTHTPRAHRSRTECRLPAGRCQTRACRPQLAGRRWCR